MLDWNLLRQSSKWRVLHSQWIRSGNESLWLSFHYSWNIQEWCPCRRENSPLPSTQVACLWEVQVVQETRRSDKVHFSWPIFTRVLTSLSHDEGTVARMVATRRWCFPCSCFNSRNVRRYRRQGRHILIYQSWFTAKVLSKSGKSFESDLIHEAN